MEAVSEFKKWQKNLCFSPKNEGENRKNPIVTQPDGGTFTQPHGGDWAIVSSAWLKWQLKGDNEAGKMFTGNPCGLAAQDKKWTVDKKNIP